MTPTPASLATAIADPERLAALTRSGLLVEPAGEALERLTRLAVRVLGVPGALLNVITADQQITVACAGPLAGEAGQRLPLTDSVCRFGVTSGEPLLIEDARVHPLVKDSIWTTQGSLVAYAGMPLIDMTGQVLGSFCVFDQRPRAWADEEVTLLADLAAAAVTEIRWRMEARERLQAEAENIRLLAAERAARDDAESARCEAETANRSKSEFLAVMSHELRTPLNAIAGYAELLDMGLRGPVTEAQRADLARIRHTQQHLLSLINDVLNFAKLESGHVQFDSTDVPLHEVLLQVEEIISPQARARGLVFVRGECPSHLTARADREKLEQVLLNLVSNAVKFTDAPGEVRVSCDVDQSSVRIQVKDTGIGIPVEKLDKVFEPFVQVDPRLARSREGTGLGLAISRDLARGMNGDLTAVSEPGVGSIFTLSLTRGADTKMPQAPLRAETTPATVAALCRSLLDADGLHAVLRALNGRTSHRFTGLYRFDPPMLRNIALFDRCAPSEHQGADAPLRETYCSIVGATQQSFATSDTGSDERVADHPARDAVVSYCGALVRDARGQPIGTLCHFDVCPQPVQAEEIPVMDAVAPLLATALNPLPSDLGSTHPDGRIPPAA